LIGAIIQGGLLGWLLKIMRDKGLIIAGILLLTASMFLLPISQSVPVMLAATAGLAVGHGLFAAPLNGLASKIAGSGAQGQVLGFMQSAASLARIVGPALGGWLLHLDAVWHAEQFGRTPYWAAAAMTVAAVWYAAQLEV
jgi:MFS family permease